MEAKIHKENNIHKKSFKEDEVPWVIIQPGLNKWFLESWRGKKIYS